MGYAWVVPLWALFVVVFIVTLFSRRPYVQHGAWGFGPYYGGPHFGIPVEWPNEHSDQLIIEEINERMLVHDELDATRVHVAVHDGHVELTGVVESVADKELAQMLADSVPGAVDVDNRLMVGGEVRPE